MSKPIIVGFALLTLSLAAHAIDPRYSQIDEMARKAEDLPSARSTRIPADLEAYTGDTTGGPSWTRPFADGTCCSALGPVTYRTQEFFIDAADTCSVSSIQTGFDGYLFVYRSPFDPLNQTLNFVAGDDDGNGGIGTSDIVDVALQGNTSYTVVTTGFAAGEVGPFNNTISCPVANVTLGPVMVDYVEVPALGGYTMILLGLLLGFAGLSTVRRND